MFRNLAIAIVSVCAVSTGSPAWSQNSPVEPTTPQSDRQYAPREFAQVQHDCAAKLDAKKYCYGEEARLLFKRLGNDNWKSTSQVKAGDKSWIRREHNDDYAHIVCWASDEGDGDPIVSMKYQCWIPNS